MISTVLPLRQPAEVRAYASKSRDSKTNNETRLFLLYLQELAQNIQPPVDPGIFVVVVLALVGVVLVVHVVDGHLHPLDERDHLLHGHNVGAEVRAMSLRRGK